MTRRLLNLPTALSLLLCVAVVALWVRSYWVSRSAAMTPSGGQRGVAGIILTAPRYPGIV